MTPPPNYFKLITRRFILSISSETLGWDGLGLLIGLGLRFGLGLGLGFGLGFWIGLGLGKWLWLQLGLSFLMGK